MNLNNKLQRINITLMSIITILVAIVLVGIGATLAYTSIYETKYALASAVIVLVSTVLLAITSLLVNKNNKSLCY